MANDDAMSDERLAQWRDEALEARRVLSGSFTIPAPRLAALTEEYAERYAARLPALLAEVERLRAREAALVEIAEIVAHAGIHDDDTGNYLLLDAPLELSDQARALLASE